MRTPLQAMLWELWRTSRYPLLGRIGGLSAMAILIGSVVRVVDEPTAQVMRGILIMWAMIACVFSPTWLHNFESEQVGFSFRLGFMRPISTTRMVVTPFVYAIGTAILCYVWCAILFGLLTGTALPMMIPAAVIMCIVAGLLAALWATTSMFSRAITCGILLIGIVIALNAYHDWRNDPGPFIIAMGKPDYFVFEIQHYVGVLTATALALVMTLLAVDHQRHGGNWERDSLRLARLPGFRGRAIVTSRHRRPFSSPIAAQYWYEMRRFGGALLLLGAIAPMAVFALAISIRWLKPDDDVSPFVWLIALLLCPLVYQIIGVDGSLSLKRNQGAIEFFTFIGTRPLRSDQLVTIKLLTIAACSLVGWLCMGLAAGLDAALSGYWDLWSDIVQTVSRTMGDVSVYGWIAGVSTAVLIYLSSSSMLFAGVLFLTHRSWLVFVGMTVLFVTAMLAQWDSRHGWSLSYLWTAYGYGIPIAILVGCIMALKKSFSAGFLASRLFRCAFCLWVIYVASSVYLYYLYINAAAETPPQAVIVLAGTMLLVPLAATAAAPLALDSHRHA